MVTIILVVDMRSLEILKKSNCPVIFDATHSVQLPGAGNGVSLGQRHFVPSLSRAAIAVGISGVFMETHPNPEEALSDGPNSVYLDKIEGILSDILSIDKVVKNFNMNCISNLTGRFIFDSRGIPTVEAEVTLNNGLSAIASVPSGLQLDQKKRLNFVIKIVVYIMANLYQKLLTI